MVWPLSDVSTLLGQFARVATADPLSAVLLLVGAVVMLAVLVAGLYLFLGALGDAIVPSELGRAPPR